MKHDADTFTRELPLAPAVNHVRMRSGLVAAICQCCGKRSRPGPPDPQGEPDLWHMPKDWSTAPFPPAFQHRDGSRGSTYTCPACNRRLEKGETLQRRAYPR